MADTSTTTATTRRPTPAERTTQMNLYTEEQRKRREAEDNRRVFITHIDDLEAKAHMLDDESREMLLGCVDKMRARAEDERVKAEEEEKRRLDETAADQPQQQAAE